MWSVDTNNYSIDGMATVFRRRVLAGGAAGRTGVCTPNRRLTMTGDLGLPEGNGLSERNRAKGMACTRRAFGGLVLGGLSSAGIGPISAARTDTIVTTAEPDGPDHLPRRRIKVLDTEISYVDIGSGEPVVFLHGNPTWSYQWRNIIPLVSAHARCLAPDFVGMGWSGKSPAQAYRFVDHARYMDAWFEALQLTDKVTLVGHDWGGPTAFYRARRKPGQIKAIAYYEAIVLPRRWEDYTGGRAQRFPRLGSPEGVRGGFVYDIFFKVSAPSRPLRQLSQS